MLELAEKILMLTESKSGIVYQSLPEDDPRQRKPDISLAKEELRWIPNVSLEDGLKETIAYFKEYLNR
jgi:UDP-glucuronate decarboxylase